MMAHAERLPLVVVGVEQRGIRLAVQHRRELPREVLHVLHAGIEAEAARRRHLVRGVAGEEDAPVAVLVGHTGRRRPGATPRIFTSRSGTPTAWRISAIDRSAVKSSAV